ncbi:hypothetical protein [Marinobacter sp. OP 3.4]|uniref:hypothetical protein n=1 Tax=Marinobacter sp. OP 3.4 TaxID=3076501 RepID=UPI002E1A8533
MLHRLLYRRKRRDRWWRFLVLKDAYIRDENGPALASGQHGGLPWAFKRFGYAVPPSLSSFWAVLVSRGATRCPELTREHLEDLQSRARELNPEALPSMAWLDLFRLCIGIGFFESARILREKALDRALIDAGGATAGLGQVTLACYAEIERERFDEARSMLERMASLGCAQRRLEQARWYVSLMSGGPIDPDAARVWVSSADLAFGDTIAGKRVALVGPVATEADHGSEIDQHDLVVKFGYRGGNQGRDPRTQGERIDISYYNNTQARALSRSDYEAVISTLRWGVCNNRKGSSFFPDTVPNLRLLTSLQWFLPDTHLNAGPNAVIDMLRFGPGEIRIFNTDMMLSAGRFAGYRQPNDKPTDYTRSFIKTHDPILQYQIMRRLWKCGYIKGDDRFEEVMAMGLSGYLEELQKAYGADSCALF